MWRDVFETWCPECLQTGLKTFVAQDEAAPNNEHFVMTKCPKCNYEVVYIPELVEYARSVSMLV